MFSFLFGGIKEKTIKIYNDITDYTYLAIMVVNNNGI